MHKQSAGRWAWLVLVVAMVATGCSSMSASLRELLDEGNSQKAAEKGQKWLDKHADNPKYRAESDVILLLVCEAEFNLAAKADRVDAYRHFHERYKFTTGAGDFLKQAMLKEASAYYRDVIVPQDKIVGYREFQMHYPGALEIGRAAKREAELVIQEAEAQPGTAAIRQFLNSYTHRPEAAESVAKGRVTLVTREYEAAVAAKKKSALLSFRVEFESWAESKPFMANAREVECRLGFEEAAAANSVNQLNAFRVYYGNWPEAAPYEPRAFDMEAGLALKAAFDQNNVEKLKSLRADYDRGVWPDKFDDAVSDVYIAAMAKRLDRQRPLDAATVDTYISETAAFPRTPARAESLRQKLVAMARSLKDGPTLYLAGKMFVPDAESPKLLAMAESEYWKVVEAEDAQEGWLRFSRWFPASKKASVAEQRYLWHVEIANRYAFGLYAKVTRTMRQPNGDIDVYVDVRDRAGNRVSGLTRDAFRLFRGSLNAEIVGFWGMEEERPLDIVFGIDMSGSMETEREAVRQAVSHFASTLDFRGRDASLGLISFSDQVLDKRGFSADSHKFIQWMSNLNSTTGGASGEDGVMTMLDSLSMLRASRGERVVIFLSDEAFQMNAGGREKLAIPPADDCGIVRAWNWCRSKCQENERKGLPAVVPGGPNGGQQAGPGCEAACISFLGRDAVKVLQKCTSRNSQAACVRDSVFDRIAGNMYRGCGDPVIFRNSPETVELIKQMDRAQLRPFFLVTSQVADSNSAYVAMADGLQGSVNLVPDDSRVPDPYVRVLMEIADQLSRQYVIRYRPIKAMRPDSQLNVVVRPIHRWSGFGTVPPVPVKAMFGLNDNPACPEFMLFSTEGIYMSSGCSTRWEPLKVDIPAPIVDVRVSGRNALLQMQDHSLWLWNVDKRNLQALTFTIPQILAFYWDGPEGFWVTGYGADKSIAMEHRKLADVGAVAGSFTIPPEKGFGGGHSMMAYPVVLKMAGEKSDRVCTLVAADRMMCSTDDPAVWTSTGVSGLPVAALAGLTSVMYIDAHEKVILMVGADGALYRSISGGATWDRVLAPVAGGLTLSMFDTKPRLVCATSAKAVECSEDAGARFFPLGLQYEAGKGAAMASIGGYPMLASDGEVQRLFRVLNRELPSSAVYFATNESQPSEQMMPFLRSIASDMRNSPESFLRVEGHADARGTTEHNDELARSRAASVADAIRSMGVSGDRIMVLSYGEKRPIQPGMSPRALARNRRVELILLKNAPNTWYDEASR